MNNVNIRSLWKFTVFASVMLLVIFTIENINGRFWLNDFKVYYLAAKALLAGQQVYGVPFGLSSGLYKYSPFLLFFVFPFCFVPFEIAAIIYFFIICFVIVSVFFIIREVYNDYLFERSTKNLNLLLSLAFICVLIHFVKELHLGNINVLLLLLLCLSIDVLMKSRFILSGILFGLVVLTKPFFLILLLPLLFRKKWKVLASLGGTLALGFLVPVLFFGFSHSAFLHLEWIRNIFAHNADYPGHNSIQYLIQHFIYPKVPNEFQYLIIAGGGLVFLIMHYFNRLFEKKQGDTERIRNAGLIMEWFVLIAILPNLVKTDSEHFLCSLPLIMLIIFYLAEKKRVLPTVIFIILIFFYGANSTDLLGAQLSDALFSMGLIGVSNLFIIVFALIIFYGSEYRNNLLRPKKN